MTNYKTELYFGTGINRVKPDNGTISDYTPRQDISDREFAIFAKDIITPVFPDGFTVSKAVGQYRHNSGKIILEMTFIVMILYNLTETNENNIEGIRKVYKEMFAQESVLRIDTTPHGVSF